MKTLVLLLFLLLALLALFFYHFVVVVRDGQMGVRLYRGKPTDDLVLPGPHLRLPGLYEVHVFQSHVRISSVTLRSAPNTRLRVLWRVANARRFFAVCQSPDVNIQESVGLALIQNAMEALGVESAGVAGANQSREQVVNQDTEPKYGVQVVSIQFD